MMEIPNRQIRAVYTEDTIRVYQAYSAEIANKALKAQMFVSPFKMGRMTWIKPSFFWMMYRCGWGMKPGQEKILAIDITREGFEWALAHACLSHYEPGNYESPDAWERIKTDSPVRIQWDPERDHQLEKLEYRSIQIGLSEKAVELYVQEWITKITDLTEFAHDLKDIIDSGDAHRDAPMFPKETPYPLSPEICRRTGIAATD